MYTTTCTFKDAKGHFQLVISAVGCAAATATAAVAGAAVAAAGAVFGGDAQPLSPRKAASVNRLEDAFQTMLLAAAQLRTAVKEGDTQLAANALKTPLTASTTVKRLASERYAQGVILGAEQPAEFDGTAFNTPVKSQGQSTMAASYAAVAVLEATVAAKFFSGERCGC
jgi:hypothetical protein